MSEKLTIMIHRSDGSRYKMEPGQEKLYFTTTREVWLGLVYRGDEIVGVYQKDWAGVVHIFSRRVKSDSHKAKPFTVETDDPVFRERDRTFKNFDSMIETLYKESLGHEFEMSSEFTRGKWVPVSKRFVNTLIGREADRYEYQQTSRMTQKQLLDRGDELGLLVYEFGCHFKVRRRRFETLDRYIVSYPAGSTSHDLTRDELVSQFPELRSFFQNFDIVVIRELRFVNRKNEMFSVVGTEADLVAR